MGDSRNVSSIGSKKTIIVTGFGPFSIFRENPSWVAVTSLKSLWTELAADILGASPKYVTITNDDDRTLLYYLKKTLSTYELLTIEIPVKYVDSLSIVPRFWEAESPALVINCGVSSLAKCLTLEQKASNSGYFRIDESNCLPQHCCAYPLENERTIESAFDMHSASAWISKYAQCPLIRSLGGRAPNRQIRAECSVDAGRYLCEFTYYLSLHADRTRAAFVHVPMLQGGEASLLAAPVGCHMGPGVYDAHTLGVGLLLVLLALLRQLDTEAQNEFAPTAAATGAMAKAH